jgi:hypothetical protein
MYGKMFRQMYHGTLATTGPWQALVTFQQLIVLADKEGIVDMTLESISRETTIPLDIIRQGIIALEQPDPDSRTPDEDGRRIVRLSDNRSWGWRLVNYKHYRDLKREEDRKEYHRQYWHKRKLNNSTKTQQTQPIAEAEAKALGKKQKQEEREARAPRSAPARRLPEDFTLTPERRAMAEVEKTDPDREFAAFVDYWRGASGAKARKHDWDGTWRNWCRRAGDFTSSRRMAAARRPYIPAPSTAELEALEAARAGK